MVLDLMRPHEIQLEAVGGKAYNLHRLVRLGLPVPAALVITAAAHRPATPEVPADLLAQVLQHEHVRSGELFAVRSSGVGEDGHRDSFAGIFDSLLEVPANQLGQAISQVWQSAENHRSQAYAQQRGARVQAMGVIIQHMVQADYAGVVFTTSPVEQDSRIALLEVVQGNGESLVSGKKTPASVRVNKLTGITRIARQGADGLTDDTIESITALVMPLCDAIEQAYGIPVDIEWAVKDGRAYILQARPITI